MIGFLDRLAARALGEAPLVHPRVRTRFEPDAGVLPAGPVEPVEGTVEAAEAPAVVAPRVEVREPVAEPRTFEKISEAYRMESSPPDPPSHLSPSPRRERGNPVPAPVPEETTPPLPGSGGLGDGRGGRGGEDSVRYRSDSRSTAEPPRIGLAKVLEEPERTESRLRRAGEGEPETKVVASSPPLPGDGSADGRGGRRVRVHRAAPPEEISAEPRRGEERTPAPSAPRRPAALPESAAPEPPSLRPVRREAPVLTGALPTVEADRGAPLPPSLGMEREESEPSETVVHVRIGRIDVRANQPAAPERRPSRPAGPRLSLGDYLKLREERRR